MEETKGASPLKQNMLTGSVMKNILVFSLPYLLSTFLQMLYGLADLFIIGWFDGVAGTTAVSIGSQVMHMLTVMIVGLAMGATVRIGRAVGAKDDEMARESVGNTATLFMGLSVAATCLLLLGVNGILELLSTPEEAVGGTRAYLTVCFIGIPCITAYNIISSIFRGMGDSKSPMIFVAIACAANIALDVLFMGALKLGPVGAALGTTLSQALSVAAALWAIVKRKMIPGLAPADFKPKQQTMAALLKVGVPVALQDGLIQVGFIAITIIANMRGLNDSAAVGIVEKIIGILFLVPSTLLSTVSALAALNIGAGEHGRVRQILLYAVAMAVGYGLVIGVTMQFAADGAVSLFAREAEVIRLGGEYLRGYAWDCLFAGIHFSFSGFFCAYGLSGISFLHNIVSLVCARLPLAYLASALDKTSLTPMGFAAPIGSLLSVVICLAAYQWMGKHPEKWKSSETE